MTSWPKIRAVTFTDFCKRVPIRAYRYRYWF